MLLKVLTQMEKIIKDHLIQRRRRLESTGSSTGGVEVEDTDDDEVDIETSLFVIHSSNRYISTSVAA